MSQYEPTSQSGTSAMHDTPFDVWLRSCLSAKFNAALREAIPEALLAVVVTNSEIRLDAPLKTSILPACSPNIVDRFG